MKYALIDGEIHHRDSDTGDFWPVSLDEAQHIVDVMNMADAQPALRDLVVALLHKLNDTEEPT